MSGGLAVRRNDTAKMGGPGATEVGEVTANTDRPDPLQGHTREWPSTPYSDEARMPEPPMATSCCIGLLGDRLPDASEGEADDGRA